LSIYFLSKASGQDKPPAAMPEALFVEGMSGEDSPKYMEAFRKEIKINVDA